MTEIPPQGPPHATRENLPSVSKCTQPSTRYNLVSKSSWGDALQACTMWFKAQNSSNFAIYINYVLLLHLKTEKREVGFNIWISHKISALVCYIARCGRPFTTLFIWGIPHPWPSHHPTPVDNIFRQHKVYLCGTLPNTARFWIQGSAAIIAVLQSSQNVISKIFFSSAALAIES